ncbi:MAG: TonB-dependent receptor, partial [Proteobacteria bacterium]|nr:TonB-dependent receptor [Pseudomonadota bacterium]
DGTLSICNPKPAGGGDTGGYADGAPDVDPATGFYVTDRIDAETRRATSQNLSALAKLSLRATDKQQGQLTLIAVPSSGESPGIYGLPSTATRSSGLTTDVAARWTAKLNDDRTEVEGTLAWHRSTFHSGARDAALDRQPREILQNGNLGTLAGLGGESALTTEKCQDGGSLDPYPYITNCPMASLPYAIGGPGAIADDREERRTLKLAATHRLTLFGDHELKAGLDYEDDRKVGSRIYSGGRFIQNSIPGSIRVTRWVQLAGPDDHDARFDETCRTPDPDAVVGGESKAFGCDFIDGTPGTPGTRIDGRTSNWAAYLRDSWRPLANLTLNAGVRYEEQRLLYAADLRGKVDALTGNLIGDTAMNLRGNFAPRLGAIYDPTSEGRAKLFVAWGRFFEAIPMDINDRSFGGEVSYTQTFDGSGMTRPCGATDPRVGGPLGSNCTGTPASESLLGSSGVLVAPGIKAEYLDETILGAEFQLNKHLAIGVAYQNRRLGRVIEDVSTDGAQTYVIANPGEWSATEEKALEARLAHTDDPAIKRRLANELALYKGIRVFDKPSRDYDAIELTLSHRATRGLYLQGSYTYAHTRGNYPGSASYDNGQVDPNISSQYDLVELLANRKGPLPQDRPHSIKLDGYYAFDVGRGQALTVGARARAISGAPINALGAHYLYGADESFLLPRGSLGRTAIEHSFDLHLSYGKQLNTRGLAAEVFVDLFNLYNNQGTFGVDETYAPAFGGHGQNNVNPISGGTYEDLIWAKSTDASGGETSTPTSRNPNFKNPTQRYAPTSAQVGFRLSF